MSVEEINIVIFSSDGRNNIDNLSCVTPKKVINFGIVLFADSNYSEAEAEDRWVSFYCMSFKDRCLILVALSFSEVLYFACSVFRWSIVFIVWNEFCHWKKKIVMPWFSEIFLQSLCLDSLSWLQWGNFCLLR